MERKKIKEEGEREKKMREKEESEKKKAAGSSKGMSMAMKMMKKMGWKEGKGLGKNLDGIDAPLAMKKNGRDTGRIIKEKALFSTSEKNETEKE
jgi:splicing factor 45